MEFHGTLDHGYSMVSLWNVFVGVNWGEICTNFLTSGSITLYKFQQLFSQQVYFFLSILAQSLAAPSSCSCCYLPLCHTPDEIVGLWTLLLLINFVHCLAATSQLMTHSFKIQNTRSPCRHASLDLSITIQAATSKTKLSNIYMPSHKNQSCCEVTVRI